MTNMRVPTAPPTARDEIAGALADHALAFHVGFGRRDGQGGGGVAGSGVLVELDSKYGILTAFHVLEPLRVDSDITLMAGIIADRFGGTPLKFREELRLKIGYGGNEGPDLGFLALPDDVVASLKARASFYNLGLEPRRKTWSARPPRVHPEDSWLLCGLVNEDSAPAPPDRGLSNLQSVSTSAFGGHACEEEFVDPRFDYLRFYPMYDGLEHLPSSFAGCSGGGVWRVLSKGDGLIVVLSGVAFYQSDAREGRRSLRCHGPRSVYARAVDAIRMAVSTVKGWG